MVLALALWGSTSRAQSVPEKWTDDEIRAKVSTVRAGRKLTPEHWPDGARLALCLSFDVDNETLALHRPGAGPVDFSAGEFGALQGLPRILELLDRQALPASFYIPAASALLHPEMVARIQASGRHEIGLHGWIHENLTALDDRAEEERLLSKSIDYFTSVLGRRPRGFRAPSWAFSRHTLSLILEKGFLYDSSMMAMDEPYELLSEGKPTGLVELPVDWILDDYPYFGPAASGSEPSASQVIEIYRQEFDRAYEDGTLLMLTIHPHISGHRYRIEGLEALISYMRSKPGVWFATAEQIAEYVKREAQPPTGNASSLSR
jgi:peptidoglycan/xylan/chitin deacetylase (PgdA/CDA1 family)